MYRGVLYKGGNVQGRKDAGKIAVEKGVVVSGGRFRGGGLKRRQGSRGGGRGCSAVEEGTRKEGSRGLEGVGARDEGTWEEV